MKAIKKAGLTLIELLIVIAIIGLIAVIVIPRFIVQPEKAKMAEAANTLGILSRALQAASFASGNKSSWLDVMIPTNRDAIGLSEDPGSTSAKHKSWTYASSTVGQVVATRTQYNNPPESTSLTPCQGYSIILLVDTGTYRGTGCYGAGKRYDVNNILNNT